MGRRNGTYIPKLRHHKASGRAVVTLSGRDVYCGAWGSEEAKKEYQRRVAEWLANDRQLPGRSGRGPLSVAELIVQYWKHVERHYVKDGEPTSEQGAIRSALRPVLELYGHVEVSDFGPQALVTCSEAMIEMGWKRYTVNKAVGRARRMFAWATERELVDGSTYHALLAVKGLQRGRTAAGESRRVKTVAAEHVEAVLPHVSPQVAAMIRVQELAGMRPGEVVQMRPCDIERGESEWIYRPARHKTEHHGIDREIPLGPQAQAVVRQFLEGRDEESYIFDPREAEALRRAKQRLARRTKVPPSQAKRGKKRNPKRELRDHYTTASYRRAIQRGCEKAELPVWHPHQLRHNTATRLQREIGIESARVVLGHQSPSVTEIYVERDTGLARSVMRRFG